MSARDRGNIWLAALNLRLDLHSAEFPTAVSRLAELEREIGKLIEDAERERARAESAEDAYYAAIGE